ncbi:MAG: hypothetical protein QE570_07825 [Verrucomicrobiota bacterium]|jgi:hypothetical protein|nr:hypothetical protein [Verrucomicrobiota bacterium]
MPGVFFWHLFSVMHRRAAQGLATKAAQMLGADVGLPGRQNALHRFFFLQLLQFFQAHADAVFFSHAALFHRCFDTPLDLVVLSH